MRLGKCTEGRKSSSGAGRSAAGCWVPLGSSASDESRGVCGRACVRQSSEASDRSRARQFEAGDMRSAMHEIGRDAPRTSPMESQHRRASRAVNMTLDFGLTRALKRRNPGIRPGFLVDGATPRATSPGRLQASIKSGFGRSIPRSRRRHFTPPPRCDRTINQCCDKSQSIRNDYGQVWPPCIAGSLLE